MSYIGLVHVVEVHFVCKMTTLHGPNVKSAVWVPSPLLVNVFDDIRGFRGVIMPAFPLAVHPIVNIVLPLHCFPFPAVAKQQIVLARDVLECPIDRRCLIVTSLFLEFGGEHFGCLVSILEWTVSFHLTVGS